MSQVQVDFAAMQAASNAAQQAASEAKGHGSSQELTAAASAIPGAPSFGYLVELGNSWDDEVATWAKAADELGADLAAAGEDYRAVDDSVGGLFGGWLGGGS